MRSAAAAALCAGVAALGPGCATLSPPDVARLEHRIRELQDQLYVLEQSRQEMEGRLARVEKGGEGRPTTAAPSSGADPGRRPIEAVPADDGGGNGASLAPPRPPPPAPPVSRSGDAPGEGASPAPPARAASTLWDRARAEYQATRYDRAIPLFEEFAQRFPGDGRVADARYWIGESYYASSNFPQAIVEYGKVVESHPASTRAAEALYKIALSYDELGYEQNALEHLERLEKGYPRSAAAEAAKPLLERFRKRRGRR